MSLRSFFELVEIRTKLASIIPFMLGTVYALYHFQKFQGVNFLLMLGSLIAIDMTTTAINNYYGYKSANRKHGYNYETHNAIVKYRLNENGVIAIILFMLTIAIFLGIQLVLNTNVIVLIIGGISFVAGIGYSFGPVPISRTPLGELVSGFFMGCVIVFLSIYIHIYDQNIFSIALKNNILSFNIDLMELVYIILLSLVTVCGIANIMLANNICDIEDDMENGRYTLPVYIGKENSLWLFKCVYYAAYASIIVLSILRIIPVLCLFSLITLLPVNRNIKKFYAIQSKKTTFVLSVKNFFLISAPLILLFWAAWVFRIYL